MNFHSSLLLVVCLSQLFAQDIRDKVAKPKAETEPNLTIDPAKSIFGIALGTSEEEVFQKLGKPKAYVVLSSNANAAVFENTTAYIFTDDKLSGVYLGHGVIDSHLLQEFNRKQRSYQNVGWKFPNGIREDITLGEIRKILGDRLQDDPNPMRSSRKTYLDGMSTIHLYFSHYVGHEDKPSLYRLHSILIKPTKSAEPTDAK